MSDNILSSIVKNKQQELISRKKTMNLDYLKQKATKSSRSFYNALNTNKSDFIFECKKASPSKGLLRDNYDLDEILSVYKDYASAISVLTDYKYFKGSFSDLSKVSQTVKQPVLCKDFFVDEYQVYEARYFGADAILLMLSVLTDKQYKSLSNVARILNLDVLTEVHDNKEMQRALALKARIIGINNRNLKTLSIDLSTTEELTSNLPDNIAEGTLFISESGINNHAQVNTLAPLVNGFLVGSSIMEKENIRLQCKKLIYGVTKICGLDSEASAITAYQQGAIYGGLIFYANSPRNLDIDTAIAITNAAPLEYVGVFVNEDKAKIIETAKTLSLSVIQLHGDESVNYIEKLKKALPSCEIWKAYSISKEMQSMEEIVLDDNVDRYLLDTYNTKKRGGSGESFDWSFLDKIDKHKYILAGGIDINNVKQASQLNMFAIDINSGVENSPGKKSRNKIIQVYTALRA